MKIVGVKNLGEFRGTRLYFECCIALTGFNLLTLPVELNLLLVIEETVIVFVLY